MVRHPDGTQVRVFSDGSHTETICVHPTSVSQERAAVVSAFLGTLCHVWSRLIRNLMHCRMVRDAQVASLKA
jgi:hypothetical protein